MAKGKRGGRAVKNLKPKTVRGSEGRRVRGGYSKLAPVDGGNPGGGSGGGPGDKLA